MILSLSHRRNVRWFLGVGIRKVPRRFSHSIIAAGVTRAISPCASRKVGS